MRTVSIAASTRKGDAEIATAEERIAKAISQLEEIDALKKSASTIAKSASKRSYVIPASSAIRVIPGRL